MLNRVMKFTDQVANYRIQTKFHKFYQNFQWHPKNSHGSEEWKKTFETIISMSQYNIKVDKKQTEKLVGKLRRFSQTASSFLFFPRHKIQKFHPFSKKPTNVCIGIARIWYECAFRFNSELLLLLIWLCPKSCKYALWTRPVGLIPKGAI